MSEPGVRRLAARDLPVVVGIERELFGASAWSAAMLAEELDGPGRWYVAADVAPAGLVGYAGLCFDGDDAQVMTIAVTRAHQGRGIGAALLAALVARARDLGARAMMLEVRVDNAPALALYERFGFVRLGRRRGYYQPENVDAWVMRLELAARSDDLRHAVLAEVGELARARAAGEPVVLLDVRWALGRTDGARRYADGHLPGAVYVDLETELAGPPSAAQGRHPLPPIGDLQAAARRWGVRAGVPVVAYDAVGGTSAARAWWLLRWAGVPDVRVLDGGLAAWVEAGGAIQRGEVTPEAGDVTLTPGALPTLDADQAATLAAGAGVLLDARAAERYRGEVEPVDPRAGHIPGALSAPTTGNLDPTGRFLGATRLRDRFAALGATGGQVGVYCGSGVTAAHEVAALASIGVTAALYPGSWSQWSADPARDVVGPDVTL